MEKDWAAPWKDDRGRTAALQRFLVAMKNLRAVLGSDYTTQQVMVLVALWFQDNLSQADIARELAITAAAASRNCRSLSEIYRPTGPDEYVTRGQHLIEGARDPRRMNCIRYKLTDDTRRLLDRFAADLAGVEVV